jgi:thiosulfate/3-mercaptopyruvate sulfurtransferase
MIFRFTIPHNRPMHPILVSTADLAAHLGDPKWIVFDTRHDLANPEKGRKLYAESHIPGAYFMHVDEDLAGPKSGKNGRHPLPDIHDFGQRINERGVTPETQVVVYDDVGGNFALRLWWMLRWLGHEKTALLDGGFPLWQKEGRPVTSEATPARRGAFVPRPHLGATVDVHFVERFHEDPSVRLLDARAAERFNGLQEPIDPVAGHVPGAINRFWQKNLDADGRFKPSQQLRKEFESILGSDAERAVHMCGSGVTACHNIFAMELAGLPPGRLYAGSWSEWCSDPARPVARKS